MLKHILIVLVFALLSGSLYAQVSMQDMVKQEYQESLTLLKSIPAIGNKTALMLLVFTDGFERFQSAKELCSYAGLTPIIRQSETRVKGR